jgi:hypothetical protein
LIDLFFKKGRGREAPAGNVGVYLAEIARDPPRVTFAKKRRINKERLKGALREGAAERM